MSTAPPYVAPPVAGLSLSWLEQYGDDLFAFAVKRVRRPETAEDLVQDSLLAAIQGWAAFEGRASVKTWLTGILRHKIADHYRDHYRQERSAECNADENAMFDRRGNWKVTPPRWNGDPQQLAEVSEFRRVIGGCMAKLPARMAYLFASRADGSASTAELCDELSITPDHAWTLLHRARLRLRACLTTSWFSDDRSHARGPAA